MTNSGGPPWNESSPSESWRIPPPGEPRPVAVASPYGRSTDGTAIGALVCGVLGITLGCVGFVPGIVAIVLGGQAKARIEASRGAIEGHGLATAGQILGWISIALSVLMVLGVIMFAALHGSGPTDCPGC